jgi:hypothetical protein
MARQAAPSRSGMCKLSRAVQLDRQDRAQGMIDISERSSIIASSRRCTNGRGSSRQRIAGMPQLSQRSVDGHHPAVAARFGRAPALPVHRRENLHRLPQGHRPPSTRYARRPGLAAAGLLSQTGLVFSFDVGALAGAGGIEPPNGGIKIRCLTAWLRPNRLIGNAAEKPAPDSPPAPPVYRER